MTNKALITRLIAPLLLLALAACHSATSDPAAGAPPQAKVTRAFEAAEFSVERPEQYPLTAAVEHHAVAQLAVTGTVNPDVARTVPVISLASGRIVGIYARLGDVVKEGQLLLRLRSDDISGAFANYQMAVSDEVLAKAQWDRAQDLLQHGAIAVSDMEIAKDAEEKAKVTMDTAAEHLRLLGSDVNHPTGMVDIKAPVAGVITDQEVTNAAGIQSLGTAPFTISDLSTVWVVCDVYENDFGQRSCRRPHRDHSECLSEPCVQGHGEQYPADARSEHADRQSPYRSSKSRHYEGGDVRHRHIPGEDGADIRCCARVRDPAPAR